LSIANSKKHQKIRFFPASGRRQRAGKAAGRLPPRFSPKFGEPPVDIPEGFKPGECKQGGGFLRNAVFHADDADDIEMIRRFLSLFLLLSVSGGSLLFGAVPLRDRGLEGAGALNARQKLLAAAETYRGTPYKYGGASKSGLDCSGLVYLSFRDALGAGVPRTAEKLFVWAEPIPDAQLRVGDLVFFTTGRAGVSHVGIYAGDGRFIHSASEGPVTGVIYSRLDESYWKRTYTGAGRALPWDDEAEAAYSRSGAGGGNRGGQKAVRRWKEKTGFFTGGGLSFSFGGFTKGAPSVFRGLAAQGKIGYKGLFGDSFQIALEMRPAWDGALGIGRIPFTLSMGSDTFQVFAGPGFTVGDPVLDVDGGRDYHPAFSFLAEAGVQAAFPPIQISNGALSFFGEVAWQPYFRNQGEHGDRAADITANLRVSAGLRYLWFIGGK
jgi:probable lipoprotein NlpC